MKTSYTFRAQTAQLESLSRFLQQHQLDTLVELGVTEIVTNAILHGNASCIRVGVDRATNHIWVLDNGQSFSPLEAEARPMGELREGGYGMAIIHKVFQNLSYCRRRGWNCVKAHYGEVKL